MFERTHDCAEADFSTTDNDKAMADKLAAAFRDDFNADTPRVNVSEDISILATSQGKPCLFWSWGGVDPELWD